MAPPTSETQSYAIESKVEDAIQQVDEALTAEHKRHVMRRIDLRVTVVCGVMFFISLLDRGNLGFANVAG